jgi:ribonuclease BN (tRNA processing enzyme)
VHLQVLGCGDAFNSGARLHACFWIETPNTKLLLDCGPSVLAGMKARELSPDSLDAVVVSHLHGDHFAGIPFLLLELDMVRRRSRELVIAGPVGIRECVEEAMKLLFPGTPLKQLPVRFVELEPRVNAGIGDAVVTGFPAIHVPETNPLALRLEASGRVLAYSGDTEWTDELLEVADGADVFLCECSTLDREVPGHLNAIKLATKRDQLRCARVFLIHMGEDVLSAPPPERFELAQDGMRVTL